MRTHTIESSEPCVDNDFSPFDTWTDNTIDDGLICPVNS